MIPELWGSVEEWREKRSTKWGCIAKLAVALLRNDEGPFPFAKQLYGEDGAPLDDYELVIPDADVDMAARGKLVIYVEFTKLLDLLVEVCSAFTCVEFLCLSASRV